MNRYQFDLATPADDADLRAVLRATPMGGNPALVFLREPNFFAATAVEGRFHQVVACRDRMSGRIVGFGSRSIMDRYVNGERRPIGYLSSLRLLPEHRNRGLVARGYAYFRELHSDARAPMYLTTIAEGNPVLPLLTSGRAGLPRYHDAGRFFTVAIPVPRSHSRLSRSGDVEIRSATGDDRQCILEFIRSEGPRRQFFPVYQDGDLAPDSRLLQKLSFDDMHLARRGSSLIGLLAVDQQSFKQTVVHAYSRVLQLLRPAWNVWARASGQPPLPPVGEPIRYAFAALPLVADNDSRVLAALLDHCLAHLAGRPLDYLMFGLHESDPLLPAVRSRGRAYITRLFFVCWDDGEQLRGSFDARPPYLELGGL